MGSSGARSIDLQAIDVSLITFSFKIHNGSFHHWILVVYESTSRRRSFKILPETTIKDVAGMRRPRQSNAPVFEDPRRAPRKRSDEIDDIELMMGGMIEVYVVAKDKLGALRDLWYVPSHLT